MKDYYEITELTNMCMVYDGTKVLVQDRVSKSWCGLAFPGGHVDKGESFTDAVIREIYEETGLTIKSPQLCAIKDWPNEDGSRYIVLCYKTDKFDGELKSSAEGKVYWIELEELLKSVTAKDMHDMIKLFTDNSISEFFYYLKDGKYEYDLK